MRGFQSTYKDRHGQTCRTKTWYVEFPDHLETVRRLPGLTDRKQTEALGRKIEHLVWCKASGDGLDPALSRWVEGLPPRLRKTLAGIGLLDANKIAAMRPLLEHVEGAPDAPGWRQYLTARDNTLKHVALFCGRVRKIIDGCRFAFWGDLAAFNRYITAAVGFARWMVREGRATENPLLGLRKVNERTDRRHDRRALSVDELRWLLDTTRNGPERFGMSGAGRALLYKLAVETGLRAGELASLTRASFALDGDKPTVIVQAGYSKHRREDVLPSARTPPPICATS
jgi:integrase